MSETSIPWPGKNDRAFAEGVYGPTQVCLDWFQHCDIDWAIAEGFKEAADKVVDDLASGKNLEHPDKFFFPVAYLYRHSLELYLKGLVWDGMELGILEKDDKIRDLLGSHNLNTLWHRGRFVLEEVWPDGDPADLAAVERIILQFHRLDKSGSTFRYSKDKKGESYSERFPQRVDLERLRKVAEGLFSFLNGCRHGLGEAKGWQGDY